MNIRTLEEGKKLLGYYIPKHYQMPFGMEIFTFCKINGVTIKALINTSCERTTMSMKGVKSCGISSLIDRTYNCTKTNNFGIGLISNVGFVHFIIGDFRHELLLPLSFDVQESLNAFDGFDLMLGLDFLKFHEIFINLRKNQLEVLSKKENENHFIPLHLNWLYGSKPLSSYNHPNIKKMKDEFLPLNYQKYLETENNAGIRAKKTRSSFYLANKDEELKTDIEKQIRSADVEGNIKLAQIKNLFLNIVSTNLILVQCSINGKRINAMIDTASNATAIASEAVKKCSLSHLVEEASANNELDIVEGVGEGHIGMNGIMNFVMINFGLKVLLPCGPIGVVTSLPSSVELILGLNFILQHFISINFDSNCIEIGLTATRIEIDI